MSDRWDRGRAIAGPCDDQRMSDSELYGGAAPHEAAMWETTCEYAGAKESGPFRRIGTGRRMSLIQQR